MSTFKFGLSLIILALALVNAKNGGSNLKKILKDLIDKLNNTSGASIDVGKLAERLILVPLRSYISTTNEPVILEDDQFQWKYIFPNSKANGIMTLKEGELQGVSSIASQGNNILHPEEENWILTVPVIFNHLHYNYRYSTEYKEMTLKGLVRGDLLDNLYILLFKIEPEHYKLKLGEIHIDRNCKRSVHVEGNHTPKIHNMLTAVLKNHLTERRFTEVVANKINTFVERVLGPLS